jgi:hypothetical protein
MTQDSAQIAASCDYCEEDAIEQDDYPHANLCEGCLLDSLEARAAERAAGWDPNP